jgi:hypothetical protein
MTQSDANCSPQGKFPDNQGKYRGILRLRAWFEVCEVGNRGNHRRFFQKFPEVRNREIILKNSEISDDIRELNRAAIDLPD